MAQNFSQILRAKINKLKKILEAKTKNLNREAKTKNILKTALGTNKFSAKTAQNFRQKVKPKLEK